MERRQRTGKEEVMNNGGGGEEEQTCGLERQKEPSVLPDVSQTFGMENSELQ